MVCSQKFRNAQLKNYKRGFGSQNYADVQPQSACIPAGIVILERI